MESGEEQQVGKVHLSIEHSIIVVFFISATITRVQHCPKDIHPSLRHHKISIRRQKDEVTTQSCLFEISIVIFKLF